MASSRYLRVLLLTWLSCSHFAVDGSTCELEDDAECDVEETALLQQEKSILSRERSNLATGDLEVESTPTTDYVVSRKHIQTDAPGLAYRVSMDLEDRDLSDSLALWGQTVPGVPVGMDWLKVGTRYLPMRVAGHPVLERAPLSKVAALSVIGQQPEVQEAAGEVAAEGEEEVVEEEEATEPEVVEPEVAGQAAAEEAAATPVALELEDFDGVVVEFGVIFRSFPVLDFQAGTFTASLAFTQRWPVNAETHDASAIGEGESQWRPNLVVTNHDIGGLEVISTSTSLNHTTGMLTQVDYLTLRARQTFELKNFPFDTQILSVHVAPASPGSVAMKLVPVQIPGEPTLNPAILEDRGFSLASVNEEATTVLETEDLGELAEPSRGVVEVGMVRRASSYFSSLFLPALLILAVCWSVFFLPLAEASLAVPRAAVSTTAFLALLLFTLHVEQLVPARFSRMWIDVFTENVAILVFAAVAFNTLEQYVHCQMKLPLLASQFSRELRVFYPSLSTFVLSLCCCATCGETLIMLSVVCRIVLFTSILGYISTAYARALFSDEATKPRTLLPPR